MKKYVDKLKKYKWYRRLCGGTWVEASVLNPDKSLFGKRIWMQFSHSFKEPDSVSNANKIGFKDIHSIEKWGSIYIDTRS